ncbi:hypothetical protein HAX54_012606 [Datura stramonium]|uniref:TMEM205-like domain-containing protein n=1 Tax=Datura stramonium TaxID=4076 RepID=A0ABS8TK11_DATST|nr:hypothetical protein [Datura stramonium]
MFLPFLYITHHLSQQRIASPYPEKKEDVIVKEGHMVVVVEYEPTDGHTKVSISPQETEQKSKTGFLSDVKDKLSEKTEEVTDEIKRKGKRQKKAVGTAYEKVKDTVAGKAHEASEKASELKEKAKESVGKKVDMKSKELKRLLRNIHLLSQELSVSNGDDPFAGICIVLWSKIYPVYFKTLLYGVSAAFLGHYLSQSHRYYSNWIETIQGLIFLASFAMIMFNSFFLEPRATKVMRERMKLEKEEGKERCI